MSDVRAEQLFGDRFARVPADLEVFRADLRAAQFCTSDATPRKPAQLVEDFRAMHDQSTRAIRGTVVRKIHSTDTATLADLVERWSRLYRATLDQLRARHPARPTRHLVLDGIDWSEALGISPEGLGHLPTASRYAEFWAERSLSDPQVQRSFDERLKFVGSDIYARLFDLAAADELLIYDRTRLSITLFDIAMIVGGADRAEHLLFTFLQRDLLVSAMSSRAAATLDALRGVERQSARSPICQRVRKHQIANVLVADPLLSSVPLASCERDPNGWALAAFDVRSGAALGYLIRTSPPAATEATEESWLIAQTSQAAWALLRRAHELAEFQRVHFDPLFSDEARSTFPNQWMETSRLYLATVGQHLVDVPPTYTDVSQVPSISQEVDQEPADAVELVLETPDIAWLRCTKNRGQDETQAMRLLLLRLTRTAQRAGRKVVVEVPQDWQELVRTVESMGFQHTRSLATMAYRYTSWTELVRAQRGDNPQIQQPNHESAPRLSSPGACGPPSRARGA